MVAQMSSQIAPEPPVKNVTDLSNIKLIPKPLPTPSDPLNWSTRRKWCIFGTLAIASFVSDGCPSANYLVFNRQALAYHREPAEVAYGVSAAFVGYLLAPIVYPLLFQRFGKGAIVLWSLVLQLMTQIWGALMTAPRHYAGYIVSRFCSGALATIPFAAGGAVIMELFFLHQRGRMFALLELSFAFGIFAIPTLGGFIVRDQLLDWSWTLWWTTMLLAVTILLVFIFMEDTEFRRTSDNLDENPAMASFMQTRIDLFLPLGNKREIKHNQTYKQQLLAPLKILIAPNVMVVGVFNMICFGFSNIAGIFVNIFLQTPVEDGGYGFSEEQSATFSFTSWIAIASGYLFLWATGDRVPLIVSRRRGGLWHPEHRLVTLFVPGILLPIGLGIFGAALRYHLNVPILALALFLVQFSSQVGVPICINYAVENFVDHSVAVIAAMNTLRLPLAISLPFATTPLLKTLGPLWVYGVSAFICLGAFILVMILGLGFGRKMRTIRLSKELRSDEDGAQIFDKDTGYDDTSETK